jgi:hypothetical protein
MPIYMEISHLHRTVTFVARGEIDVAEIQSVVGRLADAQVRSFAKVLEVAGAKSNLTLDQVDRAAAMLRAASSQQRGPIAFVLNPSQQALAQAFSDRTAGEGPVGLFTSLREARKWTEQILAATTFGRAGSIPMPSAPPRDQTAYTDPARQGVMMVGRRQREVTVRSLEPA